MMLEMKNRTKFDDTELGIVFGFLGGYINAAAIAILMFEIAPMSANWGGMAKVFFKLDSLKITAFVMLILSFIIGAYIGSLVTKKYNAVMAIVLESILLVLITILVKNYFLLSIIIGGLSMGVQNGMTTYISHNKVRTTHLTSTVTDIGIDLARKDYKNVFVKFFKTFFYLLGAIFGVFVVKKFSYNVFAIGGLYLLLVIIIRALMSDNRKQNIDDFFNRLSGSAKNILHFNAGMNWHKYKKNLPIREDTLRSLPQGSSFFSNDSLLNHK